MATLQELENGLRKAHAAGNAEHARVFANAIRDMRAQPQPNAGVTRTAQEWADAESLPVPGTDWRTPEQPARFQSPIPGGDFMNELSRSFAENIPVVGPLVDRAADATGSQIAAMITGQAPEETARIGRQLRDRDASEQPVANAAGAVAGAVGPLMSLGQTKLGEQALGLTGPLWQRAGMGLMSGLGLAGGDAAARGGDWEEVRNAALMGGGIGAVAPLAERALSPIARMLFGGYNPSASVSKVAQSLDNAGIDPAAIAQRLDDLGPDAMLLDLSPNLTTQGGAIAASPGRGQTTLREAVTSRQQGANARIQGDVDAALGPAISPRAFGQGIDDAQSRLSPVYENAFANARAVETDAIALNLDSAAVNMRGEAQNVARSLRDMLNVHGEDVLDPNPRTLFEVRKAIDGMFSTTQDGNARRLLSETRKLVDSELAAKVPGIKAADAEFKKLAETRGAFEQGQSALDSGRTALTPSDLQAQTAGAQPHIVDAMSQGARSEIDRIIGTTANNVTALKSALKGDGSWNRDRLVTLFGKDKADRLLSVLEREQAFANSFNRIVGNSETAARQAAQKDLAPQQFSFDVQRLLFGLPEKAANAAARSRSEAVNAQIADMLTGRAPPELIDQLLAARQANRGVIGAAPVPLLTNQ